ncbi:MAG: hypothetical protein KJ063_12460 [Anaerolineae bacterium]|nr:hypothetical protein [Anaerolineae bacterium]
MSQEPPEFSHWKEAWEWHAQETARSLEQESEASLLAQIQDGRYDPYYQIWYSLREKGTLANCAPVLLEVLRREVGEVQMLTRYHAAAALFHLLGYPDDPIPPLRAQVQWDHQGEAARQQAIDALELIIQKQQLGKDNTG